MYDLVVGKVVIDKLFVHHDRKMPGGMRFCPMPTSPDIDSIIVNVPEKEVELIMSRPPKED